MSIWQELQAIPREDWPKYLKQNHREIWSKLAWQKVNEWKDNQKHQASILGDTPDYDRQLFTLDDKATEMVNFAFWKYWQDDLVYKSSYLINWSVGLQTAVSDMAGEIEYEKRKDPFITFQYRPVAFDMNSTKENIPLIAKLHHFFDNHPILVSTVRPETVFGDVAVAMHPNKFIKLLQENGFDLAEIMEAKNLLQKNQLGMKLGIKSLNVGNIELILAEEVDENFGTGALKITPASDLTDYQIWKKYLIDKIPNFISSVERSGKLSQETGLFAGLTVEMGRISVIKRLAETGFIPVKKEFETEKKEILLEIQKNLENLNLESDNYQKNLEILKSIIGEKLEINWNYEHNVTICERSKTVIEPLISEEFFINYQKNINSKGKNLVELGLEGVSETEFFSKDYKDRAINFLENIKDWCISRDLVWGHPIPVWYNLNNNPEKQFFSYTEIKNQQKENPEDEIKMLIGAEKPTQKGNWVQEVKILDTWFSSCLWPLSTLNYLDSLRNQEKVVIIHGGDSHASDKDYLEFIKNWNLTPQDYLDIETNWGSWKKNLQKRFKDENIKVIYPSFPDKLNAKYEAWKIWLEKVLEIEGKENFSFVGHSLGGNFLLKYLSEKDLKVKNLILVASCIDIGDFKTIENWSKISQNCQNIYIYHSQDDTVVDFETATEIHKNLPTAKLHKFADKGHFNQEEFPELEELLKTELKNDNKNDFETFYPTQEMVTGKEIFYIWIVRMIIFGKYFTNKIPFQSVVIHPTILDDKGRKMSKSLGNGLDPVEAINKFSSDSLRLAMIGGMIPNRNMKMGGRIADDLMTKYRNFGNKLWNIAKFLENLEKNDK
jgi:valyl-tRNA synthetase/predicted alpha/beta hydrolase family esterase